MDYNQLVVVIAVAFTVIVTALNFNQISLINMSILNDGAKTLVPVAAPFIGLGSKYGLT